MKAPLRQVLMLRWLAREPWLSSTQLGLVTGEDNVKLLLHYLHDLSESGWVQRANIGEPDLPSEYVYALTDAGLRELARLEGMTCKAASQAYTLTESTLLSIYNRLPFVYDVRERLLCPLAASHARFPQVHLRVWSWPRHLRHAFGFKGWYGTTRHALRPDAYGVLVSARRAFPFFVLWDDAGATPPEIERRRLALFYQARDSGQLPFDWLHFPALVIVASGARRATEYRSMLRELGERRGASAILPSYVTERGRLVTSGPLAPIWSQAGSGAARVGFLQGAPFLSEPDYRRAFHDTGWLEDEWSARLCFDAPNPAPERILGVELRRLAGAPRRPAQRIALANLRLKPHEKAVLNWIAGQGLVLPSHLRRYFAREGETVRSWLARLKRYGLLVELHPPPELTAQTLYALSADGLRLMAWKENQPPRRYSRRFGVQGRTESPSADGEAEPPVTWRLLAHQLEVGERILAFAEAARAATRSRHSKQTLELWHGERRAVVEWRSMGIAHQLRPDAYGVYHVGEERSGFWLEVDRSHYKLRSRSRAWYSFARKAQSYLSYFKHLRRLGLHAGFPTLLVITPALARMHRLRQIFVEAALDLDMRLIPPVYLTTARLYGRFGPLAPIWRTPLARKRVHCFEVLADLPPSARFSPLVSRAEFDAFVEPLVTAFEEESAHG